MNSFESLLSVLVQAHGQTIDDVQLIQWFNQYVHKADELYGLLMQGKTESRVAKAILMTKIMCALQLLEENMGDKIIETCTQLDAVVIQALKKGLKCNSLS